MEADQLCDMNKTEGDEKHRFIPRRAGTTVKDLFHYEKKLK